MDDIGSLVVAPFQDIVDKGKIAIENASGSEAMLKAAQSLVKEGERALKRIEPLCRKYTEEHGMVFNNALKENDGIAQYREELNELLWDFDDYIDSVDDFNQERFTELQALSRKAAPKIYDTLIKMRLDPAVPDIPTPSSSVHNSSGKTDSPVPRHSLTSSPFRRESVSSIPRNMSASGDAVEDATRELEDLMTASPDEHRPFSYQLEPNHSPSMQWTQITANPWDTNPLQVSKVNHEDLHRPHRPSASGSESPVDPAVSPYTEAHNRGHQSQIHQHNPSVDSSQLEPHMRRAISNDSYATSNENKSLVSSHITFSAGRSPFHQGSPPPYPRITMVPSPANATIPENGPLDSSGGLSLMQNSAGTNAHMQAFNQLVESTFGGFEARRPQTISNHNRSYSASDTIASSRVSPGTEVAKLHDGLEVGPAGLAFDQSLPIPVEVDNLPEIRPDVPLPSSAECVIGETSSFWQAKGFCDGAREVLCGRLGVKKTKKPVGFTSSTTVARCTACMSEHDFRQLDKDVKKDPAGTYCRSGVSYRLRFLQKSHLAAKRVDDVQYGCVFCVQQGFTMDESDATVFFEPKALLDHIARHPRPLPEVPGVNVVDCIECPAPLKDNFDLMFVKGPVVHPAIDNKADCVHLPSGTAREAARRLYGQRLLFDRTPALELAAGARVTGLTWPQRHNGEWAMGWHDGLYASVPTDILKLTSPPPSQIRKGGTGMIRARAKWRFTPNKQDGDLWLKFDKNELITNIGWSFFDHWCWSGTNAKGKWGIFPQAFIDANTLEEPTGLDRATSLKNEREKSMSLMSSFRRKTSSAKPPSIAESASSRDEKEKKRVNSVQNGRGVDVFLGM